MLGLRSNLSSLTAPISSDIFNLSANTTSSGDLSLYSWVSPAPTLSYNQSIGGQDGAVKVELNSNETDDNSFIRWLIASDFNVKANGKSYELSYDIYIVGSGSKSIKSSLGWTNSDAFVTSVTKGQWATISRSGTVTSPNTNDDYLWMGSSYGGNDYWQSGDVFYLKNITIVVN